jgi:pyruvate/2-oxoglutarate dehydrogenase complex dihydrolipoamide acyltransferase (E2) component
MVAVHPLATAAAFTAVMAASHERHERGMLGPNTSNYCTICCAIEGTSVAGPNSSRPATCTPVPARVPAKAAPPAASPAAPPAAPPSPLGSSASALELKAARKPAAALEDRRGEKPKPAMTDDSAPTFLPRKVARPLGDAAAAAAATNPRNGLPFESMVRCVHSAAAGHACGGNVGSEHHQLTRNRRLIARGHARAAAERDARGDLRPAARTPVLAHKEQVPGRFAKDFAGGDAPPSPAFAQARGQGDFAPSALLGFARPSLAARPIPARLVRRVHDTFDRALFLRKPPVGRAARP